jgi:hypothetical protein
MNQGKASASGLVVALFAALACLSSCGHAVESPMPVAGGLDPDVICNAKPADRDKTTIKVSGDHFTPMPIKTMQGTTELVLPRIDLLPVVNLEGAGASAAPVLFSGEASGPNAGLLEWHSSSSMSFDITPTLKVGAGVFSVVVTNPDDSSAARFDSRLAIVPAPSVSSVVPDLTCNAQGDKAIKVNGSSFLKLAKALPTVRVGDKDYTPAQAEGCKSVAGVHSESPVELCTSLTITLPKGDLPTTQIKTVDVVVTNPAPANCVSSEKVTLTLVPPPTVAKVIPDLTCNAQGERQIKVEGTGFLRIGQDLPSVKVGAKDHKPTQTSGCSPVTAPLVESPVELCTGLTITLPAGDPPVTDIVTLDVVVTNPAPADCKSVEKVTLTLVPPPKIGSLQPPAICDDQADTAITITGKFFLKIGGQLPTVTVETKTYTPAKADGCAAVPGTFAEGVVESCTGLTIVIKKGDFPVTQQTLLKVTVKNPPPADCESTETMSITVNPPPRVDSVKPATVCEGGSQFTITGDGFAVCGASGDGGAAGSCPTVELRCPNLPPAKASSVVSPDGKTITAVFGPNGAAGATCEVVVINPDACEDRPPPHKTVTVTTGPLLFFVDPEVVFNGVSTRITLYSTTVKKPLPPDAVTITNAQTAQSTQLAFIENVPNHPNRVQATVPKGQAPGTYDVTLKDDSGCFATLPKGLVVTDQLTVTLKSIAPSFGWTQRDTAVTVLRDKAAPAPGDKPFVATPRLFLNPVQAGPTDLAVDVLNVAFVDADTVTGVVPRNTPAKKYDLVLVNPDGTVGLLKDAFTEVADAPPVIDSATPASLVAATNQNVLLAGTGFAPGNTVTLTCRDANGTQLPAPPAQAQAPSCNASGCAENVVIDASALPAGSVCVVRLTNPDGAYGEYSALGVTTPSLNLNNPHQGTAMNVGRRAPSAVAGNATSASRFVYALGGDDGTPAGALSSTEAAPVDLFGNIGAWTTHKYALTSKRTLAGATTIGRYIYLAGGDDGTGPTDSAERALILSPRETPVIGDTDLALGKVGDPGLGKGTWRYRVAAVFEANDTDNPGGESLSSDTFTVKLPDFSPQNRFVTVAIVWAAPVDSLGAALAGVAGYRIYRSEKADDPPGKEVLLDTVAVGQLTYADNGTKAPDKTQSPLPAGSTGKWLALPKLGTKRSGLAVTSARDPSDATRWYVYALLGKSAASTANGGYDYLAVTLAANGRQSAAASWTAGAQQSGQPRWLAGAWPVDKTVTAAAAGDTYLYVGGGLTGADQAANRVEVGKVLAGGALDAISDVPEDFSSNSAGYGVCAANGQLFVFGGGPPPKNGARSAKLQPFPALAKNSWNAEGLQMTHARYLLGSAVQSAFIFLIGGQTDEPSAASKTTELVIW